MAAPAPVAKADQKKEPTFIGIWRPGDTVPPKILK